MRNKIGVIIAALTLVAILIILCSVIFGGSNPPNDDTPTGSSSEPSVEIAQQVSNALDDMLDVLADNASEEPAFMESLDKLNGYTIIALEETDLGIIATLSIYAPDLYSVAKQLDSDGVVRTEEELITAINDAIEKAGLVEKQIDLEFTKTENGYTPVLTSEFMDALYGGIFRLLDDYLGAE